MQHYWFGIFLATTAMVVNSHVQDLRINVTPIQAKFSAVHDVKVILTYTNTGDETMGIYKGFFPENGLTDPIFEVTRNGEPVEYVGPLFKRLPPTADDIIYLAPGMDLSTVVELSSVFNMTKTGNYMIQYKMNANQVIVTFDVMSRSSAKPLNDDQDIVLQSAPVVVFAAGHRNLLVEEADRARTQTRALSATYISCTAAQTNTIRSGITAAENYAKSASQYANAQAGSTVRFTTWFGRYSTANHQQVKSHFSKIANVLSTKALSFDCSCPAGGVNTFAYVYAAQHYKIYLCGQYWRTSLTGTDSQAGTIIHEIAHFSNTIGTQDHAYGQASAKSLAINNPAKALANSDNVQYFAENNPKLS